MREDGVVARAHMETVASGEGWRFVLRPTSEVRLKIVNVIISAIPHEHHLDAILQALNTFGRTFMHRAVVLIEFDGDPIERDDDSSILSIVTRLMQVEAYVMQRIKGVFVRPRFMTSDDSALAALVLSMMPTERPVKIHADTSERDAFIDAIVAHEARKQRDRAARIMD
jgi:hypothetical protein